MDTKQNDETKNVHIRNLPTWIWDKLEKAGKDNYRSASAQILYVLTEWAEKSAEPTD